MSTFKTVKIFNPVDKAKWVDKVWEILEKTYSKVEGGLLFSHKSDLISSTSNWKLIVKKNKILAVAIFKEKAGQKLIAMGKGDEKEGREALVHLLKSSLERAWMEVSEAAEVFVMKYCDGEKFLIHQNEVMRYLNKGISMLDDGYHYMREIAGIQKTKILLGTPGYY